ncbi:unnamed protein product [Lupinus luteus]|uniref:Uncharacterized protein n=1 Tax=Lupinus luteus TaxID=3873 RepID=A0AAV1WUB1_LUPLU
MVNEDWSPHHILTYITYLLLEVKKMNHVSAQGSTRVSEQVKEDSLVVPLSRPARLEIAHDQARDYIKPSSAGQGVHQTKQCRPENASGRAMQARECIKQVVHQARIGASCGTLCWLISMIPMP